MKTFSIILLVALVIFIPASFLIHPDTPKESNITQADLDKWVPQYTMRWAVEDVPIGATEATSESALKTLNLDEFVQKRYTWRGREITLYIAHWRPGKMDTRFVMIHTPDVCWVANGWKKEEFRDSTVIDVDGLDVMPVQYRVYNINGHKETTYYWLLVNGGLYDFGKKTNIYPNPWPFFRDFLKEMKNGRPEHVFVRINTNMTEKELLKEPLFNEIMHNLAPSGICSEENAVK
jgi:hypothetical protein